MTEHTNCRDEKELVGVRFKLAGGGGEGGERTNRGRKNKRIREKEEGCRSP